MTETTETTDDSQHAADHDDHAHGGVRLYLMVFGVLCVLTALSFAVGSSDLMTTHKKIAWALMMAISCGKALLVIMFFMHLLWEANWKWVLTIPASMMSIFLVLMLVPDVGRRGHNYSEERLLHTSKAEQYDKSLGHGEHSHAGSAEDSHESDDEQHGP
jgi:cytochrome c oxidase subunit 4